VLVSGALGLEAATEVVDDAALERELAHLRASAVGAEVGLFGPGSLMWRIDREAAVFLGAGRALLLQLAHPWVAAAIAEHSRGLVDPIGRFHRTFGIVFTMVFGTLDQAIAAARRLHRRHAAIAGRLPEAAGRFAAGSPYRANELAALRWVHATLIDTALLAHDLVLPPLTPLERAQYYAEARRFGGLFAIPAESLPESEAAFADYVAAMCQSEDLAVSAAAQRIAQGLLGGTPWLRAPGWYRAVTARLLPARFRDPFGLPYDEREQRAAAVALGRLRRAYPLLPRRLRFVGPYLEVEARLAGRGRDPLIGLSNRFWIGQSRMPD
jgi:uncharacterized protein (DUF2236 family)